MPDFLKLAKQYEKDIIQWRRQLHQCPELGLELPKTSALVEKILQSHRLPVQKSNTISALSSFINGNGGEKNIAIRADMDGLKVQEETGLVFASQHQGLMHACGHDAHMAMVLGAAAILKNIKSELKGGVKLLFQPGEEGHDGAKKMIKEGFLENPKVDAIFGCHTGTLWDIPVGTVGWKKGSIFAASDNFELTIKSKGGHGGMPHKAIDVIAIGCSVVNNLQQIVSRKVDPNSAVVLSVCSFNGGNSMNVIPEKVEISGTVRTLTEKVRNKIPHMMEKIIAGIVESFEAEYCFEYNFGYPPVINDQEFTRFFASKATELLGQENVVELDYPTLVGEDMVYFLQKKPGTFFTIASGNPDKLTHFPNHSSHFDIDEAILKTGAALFAFIAYKWLQENN